MYYFKRNNKLVRKRLKSLLYRSFIKPTNNLSCLPQTSFHPHHVFRGLIKGAINRLVKRNFYTLILSFLFPYFLKVGMHRDTPGDF